MKSPPEAKKSRREMFRGAARAVILGALGVLSGTLVLRGGDRSSGEDCRRSTPCHKCRALARCGLPRALSAKRANKR